MNVSLCLDPATLFLKRVTLVLAGLLMSVAIRPAALAVNAPSVRRLDGTGITAAEIDRTVTRLLTNAQVTGVGIAILEHGKPAYVKAYGLRDTEKQLPLTENTVMAGASLTKAAFSYLVMQLVEEGAIDLDKPVARYLPKPLAETPGYTDLAGDVRAETITPRMLLSHTSGFPNLRQLNPDMKLNINFRPGSRYAYSGEGFQLMQLVVEAVTKKPLAQLMRERVFGPLGMMRTSMVSEESYDNDIADAHDEYGRSLGPPRRKAAYAAGSMLTTLHDFTRFMEAVAKGRGLKAASRNRMLSPQIAIFSKHQFPTLDTETTQTNQSIHLSYGLGWGLYETPYGRAFFKEGHEEGFRNYAVIIDKTRSGLVILSNSANAEGIFKELLETLLGNKFTPIEWEGFTPYEQLPPRKPLRVHKRINLAQDILDQYVGRYAVAGAVLTVSREGDRMFYQEGEEQKVEIFAEGDHQFFANVFDDVISFESDAKTSRATALVVNPGPNEIRAARAK